MMNNDRGRGATGPKQPAPVKDRYCISPQLAPPTVTPVSKKLFMQSEDYHPGRGSSARK